MDRQPQGGATEVNDIPEGTSSSRTSGEGQEDPQQALCDCPEVGQKMMQHSYVGEKNTGDTHTWCKCGRHFDSERGLDVHIGRMRKLSSMVDEYLPSNPNQGSY